MSRSLLYLFAIALALRLHDVAFAQNGEPEDVAEAAPTPLPLVDAPSIDYPAVQPLGVGKTLYVDETHETSSDLSTFSWVKGRGSNDRIAVGGTLKLGELRLAAEIPVQFTRLTIDSLQDQAPVAQDREKAATSLGDLIAYAAYLWRLPTEVAALRLGVGTRLRLPTHTTIFTFLLASGDSYRFGFPYYLHVTPAVFAVISTELFTFSVHQALLAMLIKSTTVADAELSIPNLFFWESHYAGIFHPVDWFGFSLELLSCILLNAVDDKGYTTLHNTKAFALNPGITLTFMPYRFMLVGRIGLGEGAKDVGVITFSGEHALALRFSYEF